MLNYLWAFMVLAGTLYGMITGNVDKITDALLTGGGSAIDMAMTLFGVVALWTGLMNIAMKSGLINSIQEKLSPVVTFLFPTVPKEHRARKYITVNLVSNFLGLGVAATPAGLKAMEALSDLQDDKGGRTYNIYVLCHVCLSRNKYFFNTAYSDNRNCLSGTVWKH